jgi:hypothetical protein
MADGSDPLGKLALFRMPVGAEAGEDGDAGGRHALFSGSAPAGAVGPRRPPGAVGGPTPVTEPAHPKGVLTVGCSTCGSVASIGLVEFLVLQLPFGAWLPRRTFDRWMTCPVCRRRTWTSVTFSR